MNQKILFSEIWDGVDHRTNAKNDRVKVQKWQYMYVQT